MALDRAKLGWTLVAWAFFLSVGSLTLVPIILMVVGSVLYNI